ncbi:homocysteine methyltransferase [Aureobasidium sp. EXF-10727]|nr:homocysteine methyltransferase [Aureobasidium sp. EXF-10727]
MSGLVDPVAQLLKHTPALILDGALATELETRGLDLSSKLWSAKALEETPEAIYGVHLDYFRAGADIAITASYQATPLGLSQHLGMSLEQSQKLIRRSVELAQQARDTVLHEERKDSSVQPRRLLVAGSVGPYGAFLADGSEYRGDYHLSNNDFKDFHRPRIEALVAANVDILACETIPSLPEIKALIELLESDFPNTPAWLGVTLRESDASLLSDGSSMSEVAQLVNSCSQIVSVGVNCIPEQNVSAALDYLRPLSDKPLIVYPNSGETWNAEARKWNGPRVEGKEHAELVREWLGKGARLIGGCCRTGPKDIQNTRETVASS